MQCRLRDGQLRAYSVVFSPCHLYVVISPDFLNLSMILGVKEIPKFLAIVCFETSPNLCLWMKCMALMSFQLACSPVGCYKLVIVRLPGPIFGILVVIDICVFCFYKSIWRRAIKNRVILALSAETVDVTLSGIGQPTAPSSLVSHAVRNCQSTAKTACCSKRSLCLSRLTHRERIKYCQRYSERS